MKTTTGENQKKLLSNILERRLLERKNTLIYKELLDQELPLFLQNFLQNRVQKLFHTDEPFQIKHSNRYDFSYARIHSLKQHLHEAFEEATIFSKEELKEIINRTVGLQFDLLINPQETLRQIFFKNKSERTKSEILQILAGLTDTRLFIKRLIFHIEEFDQFHILEENFIKIIEEVNKEIYHNNFLTSFISDVEAYVDFINHIRNIKEKTIEKEVIELLLNERQLAKYFEAFEAKSEIELFEIHEVYLLLSDYLKRNSQKNNGSLGESGDDGIEDFIVSAIQTDHQSSSSAVKDIEDESIILESEKHYPKIIDSEDPQNFIVKKSMIEHQPEVHLESLEILFDEKSKRLIQRKIFKQDVVEYDKFIGRIERIDNWKAAKQIIDDELMIRSIQPFSKEALKLGDLVFNRYFPKKH